MKTPQSIQLPGRFFATMIGIALVAPLFSSCRSVTYDMRQMQQPIVLNNNPFLAPANESSLGLADVDTYVASVSDAQVTVSGGSGYATTTTTAISRGNEAQVNAFHKIGGQQNRTIRNVSLKVNYRAINALFALAEETSIAATGDVAEFQVPSPATDLNPPQISTGSEPAAQASADSVSQESVSQSNPASPDSASNQSTGGTAPIPTKENL